MTVHANFVRERLFCVILGLLTDSKGEERRNENKGELKGEGELNEANELLRSEEHTSELQSLV